MGSVSSADELERFERYSTLSADESESESWRGCDHEGANYSSSPVVRCRFPAESSFSAPSPAMLPVVGSRNVLNIPQNPRMTEMADMLESEDGVSGKIRTLRFIQLFSLGFRIVWLIIVAVAPLLHPHFGS